MDSRHAGVNTLYLRLQGALQSWGERGRWTVRDTALYPTKSGVVGLLGAALGIRDGALVELCASLRMGVRIDKPGKPIMDYHTVTSGLQAAERGRIKYLEGTKSLMGMESSRWYLADASFLVSLQPKDPLKITMLAMALQKPAWFLYLGRHCCIPSAPIYAGVARHLDLLAALRTDGEHAYEYEGGDVVRMDNLVGARMFGPRLVSRVVA